MVVPVLAVTLAWVAVGPGGEGTGTALHSSGDRGPAPETFHLTLRSSIPADSAHLPLPPDSLVLDYTERIELPFSSVVLEGPAGPVRLGDLVRRGEGDNVLVVSIEGTMPAGEYSIRWKTAGLDGHPVEGTLVFFTDAPSAGVAGEAPSGAGDEPPGLTIELRTSSDSVPGGLREDEMGDPGTGSPEAERGSDGLAWLVRSLGYLGILGVIGAVAFPLAVLPRADADAGATGLSPILAEIGTRASRLGAGMALLVIVAALARLGLRLWELGPDGPGVGAVLFDTGWGRAWMVQGGAALVALIAFVAGPGRSLGTTGLGVVAAVLLAASTGLSGHAAAAQGWGFAPSFVNGAHVLSAGIWLGMLLVIAVVAIPTALRPGATGAGAGRGPRPSSPDDFSDAEDLGGARAIARIVRAFSPFALLFAGVLLLTGALQGSLHLGALSDLWASPYGRTLSLKVGAVIGVAAMGAFNYLRVRPLLESSGDTRTLRRTAAIELALGVAVVLVTAALVVIPPPGE